MASASAQDLSLTTTMPLSKPPFTTDMLDDMMLDLSRGIKKVTTSPLCFSQIRTDLPAGHPETACRPVCGISERLIGSHLARRAGS